MAHDASTDPVPRNSGDAARFVGRPQRVGRPRAFSSRSIAAPVIAALGVAVVIALAPAFAPASIAPTPTRLRTDPHADLPRPVAQPITNTSVRAQIAWLSVGAPGGHSSAVGVDPAGRVGGRIDAPTTSGGRAPFDVLRSTDDGTILVVESHGVVEYSALDGKRESTRPRENGAVVAHAVSPDSRWLALLVLAGDLRLQLIDLRTGGSFVLPVVRDPDADLPGMSCPGECSASVEWGKPVFAPDSAAVYTLTDWGGPLRLSAFRLDGAEPNQIGSALTDDACGGPAMAAKVVDSGRTLVAFCYVDGKVSFYDLSTLRSSASVQAEQPNPFWLSPIFMPDGRLLYLHQWPGFGDMMQVVDLETRHLLGPVKTPTRPGADGPFAWLVPTAYAGGVASTMPVSPDGLRLYSATDDGVIVLRIPDLAPLARLARGVETDEVWVSGDGRTIYATADGGDRVLVVGADGDGQRLVNLPAPAIGFIAAEHG
jgi:hypothetical protein